MAKQKIGIIYKITNLINNKVYIGQTTRTTAKRFKEHKLSKNSVLSRSFKKYGVHNFLFEEICSVLDIHNLNYFEGLFISEYNSIVPNGYNVLNYSNSTPVMSELTKQKLSKIKTGIKKPAGHGQKVKDYYKKNPHPKSKHILCFDKTGNLIKTYIGLNSVKSDGFCPQHVWRCCVFKKISCRDHFWFYKDTFDIKVLNKYIDQIKYSGIYFHTDVNKWVLAIKHKHIGCFESKELALKRKLELWP